MRLDHLLSKEHNTSTFPGYPDQERGVAGTQVPNVYLSWLLKESWNYWLWFIAVTDAGVSTDLSGSWRTLAESGGGLFAMHTVGS